MRYKNIVNNIVCHTYTPKIDKSQHLNNCSFFSLLKTSGIFNFFLTNTTCHPSILLAKSSRDLQILKNKHPVHEGQGVCQSNNFL